MKIKVSEASGPVLDWMVAKCETNFPKGPPSFLDGITIAPELLRNFKPSTDPTQGFPIIALGHIGILPSGNAYYERNGGTYYSYGPTPLIAAMRAYVASKLGEEVEVPEELLT